MVKNLFTFFFICLLFFTKQSIANENNPILNIENKLIIEKYFDEITYAWITNCDIIYWVTDASSAFITRHEKEEFDNNIFAIQHTFFHHDLYYQC